MKQYILSLAMLAFAMAGGPSTPSRAAQAGPVEAKPHIESLLQPVRRRGGFAVRRRGAFVSRGFASRRTVTRRGAVRRTTTVRRSTVAPRARSVRRTTVVRRGNWVRPGRYWWRPGAAVAVGAAIGWVSAATAVAWAGAAPGPDMCWYYTNASRTQGFWDVCP